MTVPLHYETSGPAEGPVLVLGASLGTDTTLWEPQLAALSDRFRVVRYDLRGHGRSPAPPGPYTIADLGADLLELLDTAGIARASYAGVSLGGMLGLWLAARAPERVDRLAVCCTSAYPGPDADYAERAGFVRARGVAAIADVAVSRWFTPAFADREPDVVARFAKTLAATPVNGYAGCCEALAGMDLRAALPSVAAPTLVVAGAEDRATPPEHGKAIAEGVPDARFVVVPGAHLANVEAAGEVTEALLGHLLTRG